MHGHKIVGFALVALLVVPGISFAQAVPSGSNGASLQAQISVLMARLQQLEAQLGASGGVASGVSGNSGSGVAGTTATSTTWCYSFTDNLTYGASGTEVTALQNALRQDGESVQMTGVFDDQTAAAVTSFQEKYASAILSPYGLTNGTGYVGAATRAELNSIFECGKTSRICPAWGCNGPEPVGPVGPINGLAPTTLYNNSQYGISFSYPSSYTVTDQYSNEQYANTALNNLIPLITLKVPNNAYPGTDFGGAHFMVGVAPGLGASQCYALNSGGTPLYGIKTIHGVPFDWTTQGGAAAGTETSDGGMSGYTNGLCYVATGEVVSYGAEIGSVAPVLALSNSVLESAMNSILSTVQFSVPQTEPVSAGMPSLSVSLDSSTPSAGPITQNTTGDVLAVYRIANTSASEAVKIKGLSITENVSAGSVEDFSNIQLWSDNILLGTAAAPTHYGSTFSYTFQNLANPIIVPQGATISLTLKGDAGSYSAGSMTDDSSATFTLNGSSISAYGAASNVAVSAYGNAIANAQTVVRTDLSITGQSVSSMPPASFEQLGSVNLTADTAGGAELNSLALTWGGSAAGNVSFLNSVVLHDQNGNNIVTDGLAMSSISGDKITWTFLPHSNPLVVTAGNSYSLSVWGDLSKIPPSSGSVAGLAQSITATIQNSSDFSYYDGTDNSAALLALSLLQAPPITVVNLSGQVGGVIGNSVPTVTMSVSPATITDGQSFTLAWSSTGATDCTLSGNHAATDNGAWSWYDHPSSGSQQIGPYASATTAYTAQYQMTCTGPGGTSAPTYATVTVNPPEGGTPVLSITNLSGVQTSYQPGQSISFTVTGVQLPSGQSATNASGFNVQGFVGLPGASSYLNGVNGYYSSAIGAWQVSIPAPSAPGTYNLSAVLYCGMVNGACASQYSSPSSQVTKIVGFTVTSAVPQNPIVTPASFSFSAAQGGTNPMAQTLSFNSALPAGWQISWDCNSVINGSVNCGWMNVEGIAASGQFTGATLTPNISGLSAGNYSGNIFIINSSMGTYATVPVALTVSAPSTAPSYGVIGASLDTASPVAGTVTAGQTAAVFARVKFTATGGPVNLAYVGAGSNSTNAIGSLSDIKVYNGSTLLGSAASLVAGGVTGAQVNVMFNQAISIPNGGSVVLTYTADVAASASGTLDLGLNGSFGGNYSGAANQSFVVLGNNMTVSSSVVNTPVACPNVVPYCPYGHTVIYSNGCSIIVCNKAIVPVSRGLFQSSATDTNNQTAIVSQSLRNVLSQLESLLKSL